MSKSMNDFNKPTMLGFKDDRGNVCFYWDLIDNVENNEAIQTSIRTLKKKIIQNKSCDRAKSNRVENSPFKNVDKFSTRPTANINYDMILGKDYQVNGIIRDDYYLQSMTVHILVY